MDIREATSTLMQAAETWAAARAAEMQLEHERPLRKMEAIERLMRQPNPLNGKAHSASSASEQVEADAEYAEYLAKQREAVKLVIRTRANYEACLMVARAIAAAA